MRTGATAGRRLGADFFDRSVHEVARDLVGCRLFYGGCGGTIVETESYDRDDPACHAFAGLTRRTATLFGPPGRAYVYLSYGIHSLLNFVAEPEGEAAAVLIRALEPTAGIEEMRERRGRHSDADLCSGPGKLTEALGIGLGDNDADLTRDPFLLLPPEDGDRPEIVTGPRIGITKATERPWRYCAANSPYVSKPYPAVIPPPVPPEDSGAGSAGAASSGAASGSGAASSVSGAASSGSTGTDSVEGGT
jgi:DNA-3-methyladenine glycosylase